MEFFSEPQNKLNKFVLKFEKAAAKVGLQCHKGKTAYMFVKRKTEFIRLLLH